MAGHGSTGWRTRSGSRGGSKLQKYKEFLADKAQLGGRYGFEVASGGDLDFRELLLGVE